MLVFTAYDRRVEASSEQAELLRLFDLSWERWGWETRVIPIDSPFRPGRPFRVPKDEIRRRRGHVFVPWWFMNLGLRPGKYGGVRVIRPDGALVVKVQTLAEAEELLSRK